MPLAVTWMHLEIIIQSEINQKEKHKYRVISLNTWNLKYNTNEPIFKTETDSDLWLLRGRGDWGGMEWSL